MVCQIETDMCAVDAIQYLTGCTLGKGNLIHRDWGKNPFTFWRRSDGKALRIRTRPNAFGGEADAERRRLFSAIRQDTASEAEQARFRELHLGRAREILEASATELLEVLPVDTPPPAPARLHDSIQCERCGEPTMATRVAEVAGHRLCPLCREALDAAVKS